MDGEIDGIRFTSDLEEISSLNLKGFFIGWPDHPDPETHLGVLAGSQYRMLAIDEQSGDVVGFITVLTDGLFIAYISLLEVLPDFQGRGIGSLLVQKVLARLNHLYAIDLLCDVEQVPFYKKFGLTPVQGMAIRNYDRQSGDDWRGKQG